MLDAQAILQRRLRRHRHHQRSLCLRQALVCHLCTLHVFCVIVVVGGGIFVCVGCWSLCILVCRFLLDFIDVFHVMCVSESFMKIYTLGDEDNVCCARDKH